MEIINQLKEKQKTGSLLVAGFLTFLLSLALFVSGRFLLKEKEAIINQKRELAELNQDLVLLDQILADYQKRQKEIGVVKKTFPATFEEIAFFASQVERKAVLNNQTLETKISATAAKESQNLTSLEFILKTEGGYDQLAQMLTDLSSLPFHTKINLLEIEEKGGKTTALVNCDLFIKENNGND